ncbi:MAG: AAA family ATPase [Anaerolineae bacterium]|nr:AAA family ATPase [Anaerolineae bacterium]
MTELNASPAGLPAVRLDMKLNVNQRLVDLQTWMTAWQQEDKRLAQRVHDLNPNHQADVLLGAQIAGLRRHLPLTVTQRPIYLDPGIVQETSLERLRRHLHGQYAQLSAAKRQLWLSNLHFLLTPTLCALIDKLDAIRRYRSIGQQRCFLVGGVSGVGKSSLLNWYAVNHLPTIEATYNHVPVIKIDAPVSNRTPKPLFQRILMRCGAPPLRGDEEHYLQLLTLYFQRCDVELLIVDEVEHITIPALRRRLLELSNLTGVPIVCASCNPLTWAANDTEIQGRWNDYFELGQLTDRRLDAFLTLLEFLLPFDQDSYLGLREVKGADGQATVPGPAHYIEQWTDGVLREVMVLITDACYKALESGQLSLTMAILEQAWRDIKRAKVVNFLDYLRAKQGVVHA